jgi:NADH-quinone oxidoreductase subunit E
MQKTAKSASPTKPEKETSGKTARPKTKPAGQDANLAGSIKKLAKEYQGQPGALLSILEKVQDQDQFRHLHEEALRLIAEATGEALSRVYSVATFYSYFNLKPQGKNTITVCRGTACHTRGSLALLQEAMTRLGEPDFREDEESSFTTSDKLFTVRTVACFGQCALAPVVAVNETIYSSMTPGKLCTVIENLRKEKKQ